MLNGREQILGTKLVTSCSLEGCMPSVSLLHIFTFGSCIKCMRLCRLSEMSVDMVSPKIHDSQILMFLALCVRDLQDGVLSPLGRQLEVCLARQVQLQNAKRNAPTAAFVTEDPSSGVPVINPRMSGFGPIPWPHASQHSLDSQVSRTQLAQRVVDRADFFKVQCSLC